MAINLSDLTKYGNIVIQCHDNPDADALASGFALKWFFEKQGKKVRLIYSGPQEISKGNLVLMDENLGINCEYVDEINNPDLLITVDCQYGESNVQRFVAKKIAVIDHHQSSDELPEMHEVRSNYGSCSTVIFELLRAAGLNPNDNRDVATALYYGLMTDTADFTEISHPSDRDLRDTASFDKSQITLFKNSNLSIDELRIAGDALKNTILNEEYRYGIAEAEKCDSNILGFISDMFLEVDGMDTCIVYDIRPYGIKFSVRSCVKEVKASELAAFMAEGLGGGGGHLVKAGGFLKKELIEKAGYAFEQKAISDMIASKMDLYFSTSKIIYAGEHHEDLAALSHYKKKPFKLGYVRAADLAPVGSEIMIRTLEGDVDVTVSEDVYIMINVVGEIYPINKKKFENSYEVCDDPYEFPGEYPPNVISNAICDRIELLPFAKTCISIGGEGIYVRELKERLKVFTAWDREKYYLGRPGDYLAVRADDTSDFYIIKREIFEKTYEPFGD